MSLRCCTTVTSWWGLLSQGNSKGCLEKLKFEILPHPPYSTDLAPCDFHLFRLLNKHLGGRQFKTDDNVKKVVQEWLQGQDKTFYSAGIQALPGRWRKCIEKGGDYVEKLHYQFC
uniref:Histone-lysine N-methyltransferase SETMAR n=1 Tax=Erpetoichthys calabaricus TaxID=27687 RepID=A0A8C4SL12_ERPCA